jgi:predicted dehydrogenase
MIKEARQIIRSGKLGAIRKIYVEYPQGWLSTFLEASQQKQADWRTDPGKSGIAGAMGDIGTHAFNLSEYVSGLQVTHVCADINVVVEGRRLDDDGAVLLKYNNGCTGVLTATQIAAGEENNVRIRVYGDKGSLDWQQVNNNSLLLKWLDKPAEILRAGGNYNYLSSYALHNCRTPGGHPEGYLEAFANLYRNVALCVKAKNENKKPLPEWVDFPGVEEGIRGMAFIETVIASGKATEKWVEMKK